MNQPPHDMGSVEHAMAQLRADRQHQQALGLSDGEHDAYKLGHEAGWDKAVQLANERMSEQLAYTRSHVAEIDTLNARNAELQGQVDELLGYLEAQEAERADQVQQFNRLQLLMNIARGVLEDLTQAPSATTEHVCQRFTERYRQQTADHLEQGYLQMPLEQDEAFAQQMPRMRQLIARLTGV